MQMSIWTIIFNRNFIMRKEEKEREERKKQSSSGSNTILRPQSIDKFIYIFRCMYITADILTMEFISTEGAKTHHYHHHQTTFLPYYYCLYSNSNSNWRTRHKKRSEVEEEGNFCVNLMQWICAFCVFKWVYTLSKSNFMSEYNLKI